MALTIARARQHIADWKQRLTGDKYPHRRFWPAYLFHHTPLENAVGIIRNGALLSRNASIGHRVLDVADPTVIQNRDRAHDFARFYFRPRTPTQYWIEGVQAAEDYYNRHSTAHAPILVVLVFDALRILTSPGTRFSTGNMQSNAAQDGDTDGFFDGIDFAKVYHEGGTGGDRSITRSRCAEVLVPSPLPIEHFLTSIQCRSTAERLTLLSDLGPDMATRWRSHMSVADDLRVFEKRYTYVENVSLQHDGVVFQLHPHHRPVALELNVRDADGGRVANLRNDAMRTAPLDAPAWWAKLTLRDGSYHVRIKINGCRAFDATLDLLPDGPF